MAGRDAASAIASASALSFGRKTIHWIVFLSASLCRFTNGSHEEDGVKQGFLGHRLLLP
jgi:hypothetical protein